MKPFITPAGVADAFVSAIACTFGVTVNMIHSRNGHRTVRRARMVAMWVIRKATAMSTNEIGDYFGRDHSTVIHALRVVDKALAEDQALKTIVTQVIGPARQITS